MDEEQGWAGLLRFAGARHGAFHLRRSAEFGLSKRAVRHRADREVWEKPYPSVFLLPGSVEGWWRTASARLEVVGSDAALGLRSAAFAQSMLDRAPALTEVMRQHGLHRPKVHLLSVHTHRTLEDADIEVVDGLRCTTPHRTMRDLTHVLEVEPLRAIGIDAVRNEVLDLDRLDAEIEAMCPGPARRRLGEVASDLRGVRTESPFAYEVIEAMADAGLEVEGEFPWRCPDGRIIHLDAAVPHAWLSVECDGRGKYASGTSFTTDRVRWTQTSGLWRTVWVDWQRWRRRRSDVLADIERAVAEADPSAPPPERASCRCRRCRRWERDGIGVPSSRPA